MQRFLIAISTAARRRALDGNARQRRGRDRLTFLSEIHDPDVEVVGILPREISTPTALVGYVSTKTKSPDAAKAFLAALLREIGRE